jgi:hypothetical protein
MRENGCELDKTAVSAKVYAAPALTTINKERHPLRKEEAL